MARTNDGHEELVKVFDTDEESEAMVVRGLLESASISAMIQNRKTQAGHSSRRGRRGDT